MSFLKKLENHIVLDENVLKNINLELYGISDLDMRKPSPKIINKIYILFNKKLEGLDSKLIPILRIQLFKKFSSNYVITYGDIFSEISNLTISKDELEKNLSSWYKAQNIKFHKNIPKSNFLIFFSSITAIIFILLYFNIFNSDSDAKIIRNEISIMELSKILQTETKEAILIKEIITAELESENYGFPDFLRYKPINKIKLKEYLLKRNSLLTDEPYFSSIIESAKKYDINPILLFSITGQEQGFVPRNNPASKEIANNPFNVYTSWEKYNTNIINSSEIASKTIVNLLEKREKDEDPFQCINKRYAEDLNWGKSVKLIFEQINKAVF